MKQIHSFRTFQRSAVPDHVAQTGAISKLMNKILIILRLTIFEKFLFEN